MQVEVSQNVKLRVRDQGEGPPVVLVHGWMVSGAVFDDVLPLLRTPARFIVPDLRGAGESDPSDEGYTIERYGRDVLAVADELDAPEFVLVGHSMGGAIAQWVAAEAPARVRGMALVSPVPASGIELPDEVSQFFRGSAQSAEAQGGILDQATQLLTADSRARLVADAGTIGEVCIQESFDAWSGASFVERLSAITARTLVLATDDPFLPAEFLQQAVAGPIANASLCYLPGPGHYPQVERPAATAAILDAFLAGLG